MLIDATVKVSKEAYELGQGIKKFVAAMKVALADGWQTEKDLPVILSSAMADMIPALQGVEQIPGDISMELEGFVMALSISAEEIAFMLLKKAE